jgi:hypothetical protein
MIDTVWKYFTDNPLARWIAGAIVALIGWEAVKRHLKEAGRKAEREASAVKQAQVKAAVIERKSEIIAKEIEHADAALGARDGVEHYPTYDSLPDDLKRIANGGKGGGEGS